MAWYWWIVVGILGVNALVVVLVALFVALDSLRSREARSQGKNEGGKREVAGQGR